MNRAPAAAVDDVGPALDWEPMLDPRGVTTTMTALTLCVDAACHDVATFAAGVQIAMTQRSPSGRSVVVAHRRAEGPWRLAAYDAAGGGARGSSPLEGFGGPSAEAYRWLVNDALLISWSAGSGVEVGVALRDGRTVFDFTATGHDVAPDGAFVAVLTDGAPAMVDLIDARTGRLLNHATVASYPEVRWRAGALELDAGAARALIPLPR